MFEGIVILVVCGIPMVATWLILALVVTLSRKTSRMTITIGGSIGYGNSDQPFLKKGAIIEWGNGQ